MAVADEDLRHRGPPRAPDGFGAGRRSAWCVDLPEHGTLRGQDMDRPFAERAPGLGIDDKFGHGYSPCCATVWRAGAATQEERYAALRCSSAMPLADPSTQLLAQRVRIRGTAAFHPPMPDLTEHGTHLRAWRNAEREDVAAFKGEAWPGRRGKAGPQPGPARCGQSASRSPRRRAGAADRHRTARAGAGRSGPAPRAGHPRRW